MHIYCSFIKELFLLPEPANRTTNNKRTNSTPIKIYIFPKNNDYLKLFIYFRFWSHYKIFNPIRHYLLETYNFSNQGHVPMFWSVRPFMWQIRRWFLMRLRRRLRHVQWSTLAPSWWATFVIFVLHGHQQSIYMVKNFNNYQSK